MGVSPSIMTDLLSESRNQCAICGSNRMTNLQVSHIRAVYRGGQSVRENMIVLCAATATARFNPSLLEEIKCNWVEKGVLGAGRINESAIESLTKIKRARISE